MAPLHVVGFISCIRKSFTDPIYELSLQEAEVKARVNRLQNEKQN